MPDPERPIRIKVDELGNFTYKPATLRVRVNADERSPDQDLTNVGIRWIYSGEGGGLFAVHFPRSPFNRVIIQSFGDDATNREEGRIRRETPPGVYNYAVAVVRETPEGLRVFIDACPEVIIECG